MAYIDGVIAAVPTSARDAYAAFATATNALFIEAGATACVDGWGTDVPHGEVTDFYRAVQAKDDETIVFGWVIWPDKPTRDAGWGKLMQDERMNALSMPFDGKRMVFGGFDMLPGA